MNFLAFLKKAVKPHAGKAIHVWNENAKPFTWTATAGEALTKVHPVQTNMKKLVRNSTQETSW
ncbi:hypothetical protein KK483_31405 [Streptomyces sp. FIT100]|nr:hypothetical protein [Streptomyces sp. FIT100]UUN30353.1 hypothetical protein KK483_31405 [Streptomyces sp. FIT100]